MHPIGMDKSVTKNAIPLVVVFDKIRVQRQSIEERPILPSQEGNDDRNPNDDESDWGYHD